jgi:hypothetical protein
MHIPPVLAWKKIKTLLTYLDKADIDGYQTLEDIRDSRFRTIFNKNYLFKFIKKDARIIAIGIVKSSMTSKDQKIDTFCLENKESVITKSCAFLSILGDVDALSREVANSSIIIDVPPFKGTFDAILFLEISFIIAVSIYAYIIIHMYNLYE